LSVLAHGLQHRVTGDAAFGPFNRNERTVQEPREQIEHLVLVRLIADHAHRPSQRPARGKHGEQPQQLLLVRRKMS